MRSVFGTSLKDWRNQRRMSQLDLGLSANVSARHISFLETGRSTPSRQMVHQLCDVLEVPPAERNTIYNAAGFAPAYRRRALTDEDMAPVKEAVDWVLERHNPYPAFAVDRHWRLVKSNQSAGFMLHSAGISEGDSLLQLMQDKETMIATFENWEEVAEHMIARLRTESVHLGGDVVLDAASAKLVEMLGGRTNTQQGELQAFVPARYRAGETVFSFVTTIAQFGTANDIALSELKIEMMFPVDETTRAALMAMG
ncbi:MAG: helix-turn-helix transcriptional regulator [Stappiaceae bacterium]